MKAKFIYEAFEEKNKDEVRKELLFPGSSIQTLAASLKPYERANCWLIKFLPKNEHGDIPDLYFWGAKYDKWIPYDDNSGEFGISSFLCKDLSMAIELVEKKYAIIESYDKEEGIIMLLMKREY